MGHFSVMRVNSVSETAAYRRAVATIIRDIQRDCSTPTVPYDLNDIAEAIDVSLGTISNAVNLKSDLNAIYLSRLGRKYGGSYLNPYLMLADIMAAPLEGSIDADILPILTALVHKLALARDADGPGGSAEVPQERAGYLPDLKRVSTASGRLVKQIEEQLA
jgi:hypothetical protein